MFNIRHVDDQSYRDIVDKAKARLPQLCPAWTDHNAHDPGITILELMAWYKELQQFYMDQTTDALRRRMLELTGCAPRLPQCAQCVVELPPEGPGRPLLSRLTNEQGMEFELVEPAPEKRAALRTLTVESRETGRWLDIGSVVAGHVSFRPFRFGDKTETELCLGFYPKPEGALRLWCEVAPPDGIPRNPPAEDSVLPRKLVWEAEGCGELTPWLDETWALSWSGYVMLPVPEQWKPGKDGLYWLRLRETEPGCEGEVRLSGVYAGRYRCAQQRTRAKDYRFRVEPAPEREVTVSSAQAVGAALRVFLRCPEGWRQVTDWREGGASDSERRIVLDSRDAAQDGDDNLLVVCGDPGYAMRLYFTARGRPEEKFFLDFGGQQAMSLSLICPTLHEDGVVRPARWHQVEDLAACSPRDRVFVLDRRREYVRFGDGAHGSVVSPGEIVVAELVLSRCGAGNVPRNAGLYFESDGMPAANSAAQGGQDPETPQEAGIRLRRALADTKKCETAEDYELCASRTPGLRVAFAKALPGYDPDRTGQRRSACVAVVVLPETEAEQPMPDKRFLGAVNRQLERFRSICIQTRAIPPRYVPLTFSALLAVTGEAKESAIRSAVREYFSPRAGLVGRTLRRDDLAAELQRLPGVLHVRRLELRGTDQNSYRTAEGDLNLPPDALPWLERLEIALTDRLGR